MSELETREQLDKFIDAVSILMNNDIATLAASQRVQAAIYCSFLMGEFRGRIIGRSEAVNEWDCQMLQDVLGNVQAENALRGDPNVISNVTGFLARSGDYVDEAFDIALNDKELPSSARSSTKKMHTL